MTEQDRNKIISWINENNNESKIRNPNCNCEYFYFNNIYDIEIKNIISSIKNNIINIENLNENFISYPYKLGDFIAIYKEGFKLHRHRDENDNGYYHIRFNAIVQNPIEGGIPIYNGKIQKGNEREYLLCRSGLDYHETTKVIGEKSRIVISFGFNIPTDKIELYPNIFKNNFSCKT